MEQWHGESSNLSREFVVKHVSSSVTATALQLGYCAMQERPQVQVASLHPAHPSACHRAQDDGQDSHHLVQGLGDGHSALLLHVYGWEGGATVFWESHLGMLVIRLLWQCASCGLQSLDVGQSA